MSRQQSRMSPFNVDCVRLDFKGRMFGLVQDTIRILEYEEEQVIMTLNVYPIGFAEKEGDLSKITTRSRPTIC